MTWYKAGTVSVTNGLPSVVGTGTAWIANTKAGDVFIGPDFSTYEILSVNSNISLTLASPYRGATGSGSYSIQPTSDYVRGLTAQVAALLAQFAAPTYPVTPPGGVVANAEFIGLDPLTGIGDDVQEALARIAQIARNSVSLTEARFGPLDNTGVADCRAAFEAAVAATGSDIIVPPGTYRVVIPVGTGNGIFMAGKRIRIRGFGRARTKIIFETTDATQRFLFRLPAGSEGFEISGLSTEVVNTHGAIVMHFSGSGLTGLRVIDCELNGGVTDDGTNISHQSYGISFPTTGVQTDITVDRCEIHHFTFFVLKTNASTSEQRRLKFLNSRYRDNYEDSVLLNTPNGIIDDAEIIGNSFESHRGYAIGRPNAHHVAVGGNNLKIMRNHFSGAVYQAIHIEENPRNFTVSFNTFDIDGIGIVLLDNRISGVDVAPSEGTIIGNVLRKQGTNREAGSIGIWLVNDGGTESKPEIFAPAKRVKVANNQARGFEHGYFSDAAIEDACSINANDAYDCQYGFTATKSSAAFDGNRSHGCEYGVWGRNAGACFRNHGFVNCANTTLDTGRWVMLVNPYFEWDVASIGAGATIDFVMLQATAGSRISGAVSSHAATATLLDTDFTHDVVKFDGTTGLVNSGGWDGMNLTAGVGGLALATVFSGGQLRTRVFSVNARSSLRVASHFNGTMLSTA